MTRWNGPVIATVDMLMSLMVAFLVQIEPPAPPVQTASDRSICEMAVDITWKEYTPIDIDLWVMGPDKKPVGYMAANKSTPYFDLVRDDLGTVWGDETGNQERICARGMPDGEYVVNAHMYTNHTGEYPVPAHVEVSSVDVGSAFMKAFLKKDIEFTAPWQEITVFRFEMKDGKMVAGSERNLPIKVRPKK